MTAEAYFDPSITMAQYLADRGRLSGHVLTMVDREPERFGAWLRGESDDRSSPYMDQGIFFNDRLLEPAEVSRRYAFLPSRAEFKEPVMVPAISTRGKTKGQPLKTKKVPKLDESGQPVLAPQDPEAPHLSMLRQTDLAKDFYGRFHENARRERLTVVTPEQQTTVNVMLRAVWSHPLAASLLNRKGLRPELTGHWTCPETGEPLQLRADGIDEVDPFWLEVKTITPKGESRLDTLDHRATARWARAAWARKSALLHDGMKAITGKNPTGYWLVVEAVDRDPRVSVVEDRYGDGFHELGRDGCKKWGIAGYLDLILEAQRLREERDFRHECVRGLVGGFPLPPGMAEAMVEEEQQRAARSIKGARKVAARGMA